MNMDAIQAKNPITVIPESNLRKLDFRIDKLIIFFFMN